MIRGKGGNFIVLTGDGRELWHKRRMGDEFPEHGEILARLRG